MYRAPSSALAPMTWLIWWSWQCYEWLCCLGGKGHFLKDNNVPLPCFLHWLHWGTLHCCVLLVSCHFSVSKYCWFLHCCIVEELFDHFMVSVVGADCCNANALRGCWQPCHTIRIFVNFLNAFTCIFTNRGWNVIFGKLFFCTIFWLCMWVGQIMLCGWDNVIKLL